jgi:hypothetical protein
LEIKNGLENNLPESARSCKICQILPDFDIEM